MKELFFLIVFQCLLSSGRGSLDEERLVEFLFDGYNSLIRPAENQNSRTVVNFKVQLVQLINVNEKDQIMKTNVWLRMSWFDHQLKWDPVEYGGIEIIRIPHYKVWTPDIVLFNNADGNYEVSYKANIILYSSGTLEWIPPAIYKSSCTIDVEFFPFDQQECEMRFGSWTFTEDQLTLDWMEGLQMADLNDYLPSGAWDVIACPANITENGVEAKRIEMVFTIVLRRKTLFYTVNLLIPVVLISCLSIGVFYLPTDAGEKMTLCISILLALVVFLLLVSKILPPTSLVIPLIAKYLLFTFIMNIITILVSVITINWNYRTPRTHHMPNWVRVVFLRFLPKYLFMQMPRSEQKRLKACNGVLPNTGAAASRTLAKDATELVELTSSPSLHRRRSRPDEHDSNHEIRDSLGDKSNYPGSKAHVKKTVQDIEFIASHLKSDDDFFSVREDWKYVALVIDRILLIIFTLVTGIGTCTMFLRAPNIFEFVDQDAIINKLTGRLTP